MKHLHKFNESVPTTMSGMKRTGNIPGHPNIDKLIEASSDLQYDFFIWYDNMLSFDKDWDEYVKREFHNFEDTSEDELIDYIENHPNIKYVFKFAQERFIVINEQNKEDLEAIRHIFNGLQDECPDYLDQMNIEDSSINLRLKLKIYFNIIKNDRYSITLNEMKKLWYPVISACERVKSIGYDCHLHSYNAASNNVEFTIGEFKRNRRILPPDPG